MIITPGELEKFFPEKLALLKNGHERELFSPKP